MFFTDCPTWHTTVMLSASSIVSLRNTAEATEAVLRCHCRQHMTSITIAHAAAAAAA